VIDQHDGMFRTASFIFWFVDLIMHANKLFVWFASF